MAVLRTLGALILIIGVFAIIAGVIYLRVPAESLPSFFPGHIAGVRAKHATRGGAGVALGVVLAVMGGVLVRRRRSANPR